MRTRVETRDSLPLNLSQAMRLWSERLGDHPERDRMASSQRTPPNGPLSQASSGEPVPLAHLARPDSLFFQKW